MDSGSVPCAPAEGSGSPQKEESPCSTPESIFKPRRPLVDARTEISPINDLTVDCRKNAVTIAQYIGYTMNSIQRLEAEKIPKLSNKIFKEAIYDNVTIRIFMDAIETIPVDTDIIAALISYFANEYNDTIKKKLITELIPNAITTAFREDRFTSIKRILHFLGFFADYRLVTAESYCSLLNDLADKLEDTKEFRCVALCHAILFACRVAPDCITDDEIDRIVDKVTPFAESTESFVRMYYPCNEAQSAVQMLLSSVRIEANNKSYVEKFERATPIDLPQLNLEFGEVDKAPPPKVYLTSCYTSVQEYFAVMTEMATDCIYYLEKDHEALTHQLLALPLVVGQPSLKSDVTAYDHEVHDQFVEEIFTAIFSDLLRIPYPTYPLFFYVSIITQLLKIREKIWDVLQKSVEAITGSLSSLGFGTIRNLIKVLAHFTTNNVNHYIPLNLDNWIAAATLPSPDMRSLFIKSFIEHVKLFSSIKVHKYIHEDFYKITKTGEPNTNIVLDEAKELRDILDKNTSGVPEHMTLLKNKIGEFDAFVFLISVILRPDEGQLHSAEKAYQQISHFSKQIPEYFDFKNKGNKWIAQGIVQGCFNEFSNCPIVMSQLIVYLITDRIISPKPFIQWFFDVTEKNRLSSTTNWDIFTAIMTSVFQYYETVGEFDGMTISLKKIFKYACRYFSECAEPLTERLLLGNLLSFTLLYCNVLSACRDDIYSLISEKAKKEFVDLFDKLSILCQ